MNIQEATEKALKEGKYIMRRINNRINSTKIKPTNSHDCCFIVSDLSTKKPSRCWNPTAEDLMSSDWEITE